MSHGMYVFDRAIRKSNSKIYSELRLVSNGLSRHFEDPVPVLGKNAILEGLLRHRVLFRIKPKQVAYFGRSIRELSTAHIPGPTARMTQMLGFGQVGLAASQLPFRFLCNRNIRHRPKKLDAARWISRRTRDGLDVFHRAIRQQQSIFVVEILSVAGRLIDGLLHGGAVFRMGTLENKFQGRFRRPVALEDSEGLL